MTVRVAATRGRRPSVSAPLDQQSRPARAAQRERWARQPGLGALGLLLVLPVALLLALAAGGPEPSLLVLAPLVTYGLPVVAMVAFWWDDWPGSTLRASWSGWADTVLVIVAAVGLTLLGQAVVDTVDVRAVLVLGRLLAGPDLGALLTLIGAGQVGVYVLGRGWPVARSGRRAVRLVVGNVLVLGAAGLAYAVTRGVDPGAVSAAAGCVVAAGLLYGMLFEGFLRDRLPAATERAVLVGLTSVTAVVLDLALGGYAGTVAWTRGTPDDWVTHASLNALGVGVILHVAIGRRWPFGRPAPAAVSAVEPAQQGLRSA